MKWRIFLILMIVPLVGLTGCADTDESTTFETSANESAGVALVSESTTDIEFSVSVDLPELVEIQTDKGQFLRVELPGYDHHGAVGTPALPAIRKIITLPHNARVTVNATPIETEVIPIDLFVMPNQAPVEKLPGALARAPFAWDADAYSTDGKVIGRFAALVDEGMMRNHRLGLLEITPVEYNPARRELTVVHRLAVNIHLEDADVAATQEAALRHGSFPVDVVVAKFAANTGDKWSLFAAPEQGADYLILYASAFHDAAALNAFADLKESDGWTVHLANMNVVGNSAQEIRDYIVSQYYLLPNLTFVLLVGDTDKITHVNGFAGSSPATDLYYSCITQDYIPDLLIGRFPVRTLGQLSSLVDKISAYENETDVSWKKTATFMASVDRYTVSEGTHNAVINYFLNPSGFTSNKLYSYTYSATSEQVRTALNSGTNFGIYSGHGSETSWSDGPYFNQDDVRGLVNTQYPFVGSFACYTGKYQLDECFAETWVRDDHGAAAMVASSVTSYWDEDDWFEKGMFLDMFNFPFPNYPNQVWAASANLCGKATVWVKSNRGQGSSQRYFEMYNLFGDPSMVLYTN